MELHLDLVGGLAGDMFVAAMLDLFPDLEPAVQRGIAASGLPSDVACRLVRHDDGVLVGRRFVVERTGGEAAAGPVQAVLHEAGHSHEPHDHHHHHAPGEDRHRPAAARAHHHVAWRQIRDMLAASPLDPPVRAAAIGMFALLADAEGAVHGVDPDAVTFHEVGAWDSIADIVGAAVIVAAVGARRWTVGAVPLGSGRVEMAHGSLPVPAPATARLLTGFAVIDDGVPGERVTPTGAAILRYLCGDAAPVAGARILGRSGVGFGTRCLPGLSNCVRVLAFGDMPASAATDEVAVIEFEIDDASGEELARGLDFIRAHAAVHDAIQAPVFGKKGRMMTHVRVLAEPAALEEIVALCFRETTTIGLRHAVQRRAVLPRQARRVAVGAHAIGVKIVERGDVRTAKAEADDVASVAGHAGRAALRHAAERSALENDA
ncbi:LarC family nickel insertion protein [Labrys monachus]|uniref:Uncharacterized protein (TIGR00299 family) protein n=1 Tax=Labrys monachus TaxID=217067 RepID=A0ABU0FA65_9HYPH|nr:LarC family nickel insertion protein [Labrys monachus]MDQ0391511.1 uncharacterized protein (TIGR00299 family) protein [Labrys monachus]